MNLIKVTDSKRIIVDKEIIETKKGKLPKFHKDAHEEKEIQLQLSQHLFDCDDVKGGFD